MSFGDDTLEPAIDMHPQVASSLLDRFGDRGCKGDYYELELVHQ